MKAKISIVIIPCFVVPNTVSAKKKPRPNYFG